MSHALIDRLLDELGYAEVSLANHDEFVAQPGMNVLFFPGNPGTVKDSTDVAVVLPELVNAFNGQLTRIQDWADYLNEISDLLVAPPKRAPGFSIPVVAG